MGKNLSPALRRELKNLDRNPDSCNTAMKALKSYVKDLDYKTIPLFLAYVSETKDPGSSFGECTISLFEVLARVHGRSIVPHIDSMMSTIVRTLSSSAGSFSLHQACSKLVLAIARFGIDPSTLEDEKKSIICSLCKPLSDCLMGRQESAAAGAAICIKALVESDNWRFASDEMVNEVCLKVTGALEEKQTRTNSHLGLVVALLDHNVLITEAYARSLMRSGLQILTAGGKERSSHRRLSAIHMINILMKCVDLRIILSEIPNVIGVLEICQSDLMSFVREAAFDTLQIAKAIAAQKDSSQEISSSPVRESNFCRRKVRNNSWATREIADTRSSGSLDVASPESQTVDYETPVGLPLFTVKSSSNSEHAKCFHRMLWSTDCGVMDMTMNDGFSQKTNSSAGASLINFQLSINGDSSETHEECTEALSECVQHSAMCVETRDGTPHPQRSRQHLTFDEDKIHSTPCKLLRSLQNSADANSGDHVTECCQADMVSNSGHVPWRLGMALNGDNHSDKVNCKIKGRNNCETTRRLKDYHHIQDAELATDAFDLVSSGSDIPLHCSCKTSCGAGFEDSFEVPVVTKKRSKCSTTSLRFLCCLCMVSVAIIFSWCCFEDRDGVSNVVPT